MTSNMHWTQELSVGVPEIDAQHRELIERVNRLVEGCEKGNCTEEVGPLIQFLKRYAETHFADEEDLMERCGFPERDLHRDEHRRFRANLEDLEQRLQSEGPGRYLLAIVSETVIDWLFAHICARDRALGRFIARSGGNP